MNLTVDQVLGLSPDAASSAAGKKLANASAWQNPGQTDQLLWGECKGSALYQTRILLTDLSYKCSCPSRKFPCKHVLGLMLLAAAQPGQVPKSAVPAWVAEWVEKREASSQKREARAATQAEVSDPAAQAKRAEKRTARVADGIAQLDVWLGDLARRGLASLEAQPHTFWENQAARLVDAQAPGLASRLRRMAALPGSGKTWPAKVAEQLGRLALVAHAFGRREQLAPGLEQDLRQIIGWTVAGQELAAGEKLLDDWLVVGQSVEHEDRVRVERSWLLGEKSRRVALILQFAPQNAPFPELIVPGTSFQGEITYFPGEAPQRARIVSRRTDPQPITGPLGGCASHEEFLAGVAQQLSRQPWRENFLCVVSNATPVYVSGEFFLRDSLGAALPLVGGDHWQLMALAGGNRVEFSGQWDGQGLLPMGVLADGEFHVLKSEI